MTSTATPPLPERAPIAVASAPNGARKTHADHPALPITPDELAATARACLDAGAAMLHLHVRHADGTHSLEAADYLPAIERVRQAVGQRLVLQVTTEAVGRYTPAQQMAVVRELRPEAVSAALRELVPDAAHESEAAAFFGWLAAEHIVPQYILYDAADVGRYFDLRQRGLIPPGGHWVLFVLGRYSAGQTSSPDDLLPFLHAWHAEATLSAGVRWAVCAFGAREAECALAAALLGGHARLGFENNMLLAQGELAPDNATLIRQFASAAGVLHRPLADAEQLRSWFA